MNRRSFLNGAVTVAASALLRPPRARAAAAGLDLASAVDAARAIRAGQVSSVELTNLMLARIAQYNPKLNAIVTLTADAALARAREADEARARGEWWGPFHGVPATIKDTFETAGVRTTAGAPMFSSHVPARDAAVVERLRRAGVVILGKTNVPRAGRRSQPDQAWARAAFSSRSVPQPGPIGRAIWPWAISGSTVNSSLRSGTLPNSLYPVRPSAAAA